MADKRTKYRTVEVVLQPSPRPFSRPYGPIYGRELIDLIISLFKTYGHHARNYPEPLNSYITFQTKTGDVFQAKIEGGLIGGPEEKRILSLTKENGRNLTIYPNTTDIWVSDERIKEEDYVLWML